MAIAGAIVFVAATVVPVAARRSVSAHGLPLLRPLRWWFVPLGLTVIGASSWLATSWLLSEADMASPEQRPAARIEAIRTGLTIGVGTGGGFALLLAARRQWLSERTQIHQEYDARETRVTELYVKAADQLGSDRAPVRLAGLHALERLASTYPRHRQTIVDLICAYLRMPMVTDEEVPGGRSPGLPASTPASVTREEREVRLVAQRILARHLRYADPGPADPSQPGNSLFWRDITVDLSGALLTNLLSSIRPASRVKRGSRE